MSLPMGSAACLTPPATLFLSPHPMFFKVQMLRRLVGGFTENEAFPLLFQES